MKVTFLLATLLMIISVGCGDNSEQPPEVEIYAGELEIVDLQEPNPYRNTNIDTVVFTVEGKEYSLEHVVNNSGLCESGGDIAHFGGNLTILTPVFIIPKPSCDSIRIPQGEFTTEFRGDSLIMGPKTIEFDMIGTIYSLRYTFRLSR